MAVFGYSCNVERTLTEAEIISKANIIPMRLDLTVRLLMIVRVTGCWERLFYIQKEKGTMPAVLVITKIWG